MTNLTKKGIRYVRTYVQTDPNYIKAALLKIALKIVGLQEHLYQSCMALVKSVDANKLILSSGLFEIF